MVQKTVEIPQLQFFNIVVVFSFRAADADPHGPDFFSRPLNFHSCCTFQVVDVSCCAGRACRAVSTAPVRAVFLCFRLAKNASYHRRYTPRSAGLLVTMLLALFSCSLVFSGRFRHLFQCPAFWFNSGYTFMSLAVFYDPLYLADTCSEFACRVQDSGLFWVMTSGYVPVFSASWFNTGHMSTSVDGDFWLIFTYL